MITINNSIITMTKGDSVEFTLPLLQGIELNTEPIDLSDVEKIEFNIVASNQPSEYAFIKKEFLPSEVEEGNLIVSLEPEDTEDLCVGKYYYEVKLLNEFEDFIYTVIPRRLFYLTK